VSLFPSEEIQPFAAEVLEPEPPRPARMRDLRVRGAIEAILYATDQPVTIPQIASLLRDAKMDAREEEIARIVADLAESCARPGRGMEMKCSAGAWQIVTRPEYRPVVDGLRKLEPPLRLSRAAWETLAVIAHLQPVTASDIAALRDCDVSGVLETLLTLDLIYVSERRRAAGRPRMYRTTKEFLRRFGLRDLSELPAIGEFRSRLDTQNGTGEQG
jgi:segregation and condensation protein B